MICMESVTALYKEFLKNNSSITWADIASIEKRALVAGNATPEMADALVTRSIQQLRDARVIVLRIPHGP
jgi:hypothetical protein